MSYDSFDLTHSLNASIFGEQLKQKIFETLDQAPKEVVALTSFLTAPVLATITLLTKVATIVEIIFKGIISVIGICITNDDVKDKDDLSTWLSRSDMIERAKTQALAIIPAAIDLIFGAPLYMFYNLTGDLIGLLSSPCTDYVSRRRQYHENKVDELMASRSHTDHFQFLVQKAHESGVGADELNKIINKLNVKNLTNENLEEIKEEFDFAIGKANTYFFASKMNLMLYGNDHNPHISHEYMQRFYERLTGNN